MKNVLIVENTTSSLKESVSENNKKDYVLSGIFTEFGKKNRNDRIYTADKFLPALKELTDRMQNLQVVYGELDHPDVYDTSMARVSHKINKVVYNQANDRVDGEIKLLPTHYGKDAMALIDANCPLFVSSRAAGLTDESTGNVVIQKLFTYDIVADPGFACARMNVKPLNESMGYKEKTSNFRIYPISDENKINEIFNMNNNNEAVTKKQFEEYSKYLTEQMSMLSRKLKNGNAKNQDLSKLLEWYDSLQADNQKMKEYLNYLSTKVNVLVNENSSLKNTQKNLIKHNNYLAESIEKTIKYSEYIAENVDKSIAYSEYIAENVDKSIKYSEYIAENVDKSIKYSEYIAENVDKNIAYAEYIAENVDNNIAFSEYIAENTNNNIEYSKYMAKELDKSIVYQGKIAESVNNIAGQQLNESVGTKSKVPTLKEAGFEDVNDEKSENRKNVLKSRILRKRQHLLDNEKVDEKCNGRNCKTDYKQSIKDRLKKLREERKNDTKNVDEQCDSTRRTLRKRPINRIRRNDDSTDKTKEFKSSEDLNKYVESLISNVKNQKIDESDDLHFLTFLSKDQVLAFNNLSRDDKNAVKSHIKANENLYFSSSDVVRLIQEALEKKKETLEERILRCMPDDIKPKWNKLSNAEKKSMISQAKLFPAENLKSCDQIAQFWNTRSFKNEKPAQKKLVESTETLLANDKLSKQQYDAILERINNL